MFQQFDLIVIGGGSGGIAAANRAASHGAKVALVEKHRLGGTCVNVGCVPKKVMWNAAQINSSLHTAGWYGFAAPQAALNLDFSKLVAARDAYVDRLNGIYRGNLEKNGVRIFQGTATFVDGETVDAGGQLLRAPHRLIAVGGRPTRPDAIAGGNLAIDSDGFFALKSLPKRVAVIGGGYIAVELASVLRSLGCQVDIYYRAARLLRSFDREITEHLERRMTDDGIACHPAAAVDRLEQQGAGKIQLHGKSEGGIRLASPLFDQVILAIGRQPATRELNLAAAGVELAPTGHVVVDAFQNTNVPGTYAVGDVTGRHELTPVAIAAGRQLAERLFNGRASAKLEDDLVPTVVFSHPPIGSVGLSEEQAADLHGTARIKCYRSRFTNMLHSLQPEPRPQTFMKLVTLLPDETVIGLHGIGEGMDEILQGFAVALKLGATKSDLDRTIAIHPTAAEEFVTMR